MLKGTHRFLADAVGWVVVSLPRREDQGRTQVRGTVGVEGEEIMNYFLGA